MALMNCPECGKEVSDKASACPNCGYRITYLEKSSTLIKYAKIGIICLLVVVVIIALCKATSTVHSPFEKFSPQMTKEDIHEEFGEPIYTSTEYDAECYGNSSFVGLYGKLFVWYKSDESIDHVYWEYDLKDGETLADCSKQVQKIKEFFTEMYGPPSEKYGYIIWEDSVGQEYGLKLDSDSTIKLKYEP